MRARLGIACALPLAGAVLLPGVPAQAASAPTVDQLVVFRSGKAVAKRVSTRAVGVRVGRRRCAVSSATPLAGLARARVARLRLLDFGGNCSRRARDSAGLFVQAIGRDRNRGQAGWVYKVGQKVGTAGAADPGGPFGRGRLRKRQRVTWFYCRSASRCQRTLVLRARVEEEGTLLFTVVGYDDEGRGVRVAGATIRVARSAFPTGPDGTARAQLTAGSHRAYAEKSGLVRSFSERLSVR